MGADVLQDLLPFEFRRLNGGTVISVPQGLLLMGEVDSLKPQSSNFRNSHSVQYRGNTVGGCGARLVSRDTGARMGSMPYNSAVSFEPVSGGIVEGGRDCSHREPEPHLPWEIGELKPRVSVREPSELTGPVTYVSGARFEPSVAGGFGSAHAYGSDSPNWRQRTGHDPTSARPTAQFWSRPITPSPSFRTGFASDNSFRGVAQQKSFFMPGVYYEQSCYPGGRPTTHF